MTQFDSQLGFAIRRWCAPLLDLPARAPADAYWARRAELGSAEVTRRLLRAAGVSDWLVDTGFAAGTVLDPAGMAAASGAPPTRSSGWRRWPSGSRRTACPAGSTPTSSASRLALATRDAVGVKSVLAYRAGFDVDPSRPGACATSRTAAQRWVDAGGGRLVPTRCCCGTGCTPRWRPGCRSRSTPGSATGTSTCTGRTPSCSWTSCACRDVGRRAGHAAALLPVPPGGRLPRPGVPERPHGRRPRAQPRRRAQPGGAGRVRSSSPRSPRCSTRPTRWGPPELHHLGAVLWRRAVTATFGGWVEDGDWSPADAERVADMVGRGNAERVYRLG